MACLSQSRRNLIYTHLASEAWEQDYHRVAFVAPEQGAVHALTKRRTAAGERLGRVVLNGGENAAK